MNLKDKTNSILNRYNLKAKKKFGQNFLVDENVLDNIVNGSDITSEDVVIEIGPGLGNLTEKLLEKAKKVIAFEIDKDMCEILENRFQNVSNFILLNEDVLKVDIKEVLNKYGVENEKVKLVANLPYYITTPIMFKIFENTNCIDSMTIMVQKEVADRIVAKTKSKDYGVLTINTKFYGEATKLFDVPNNAFVPAPNVTSAVVKIAIWQRYSVSNKETLFKLVKASFAQRRKKLINSLENSNVFDVTKTELKSILENNGITENARAEEIELETYINVANELEEYIKNKGKN